jgi:hypothetical protein
MAAVIPKPDVTTGDPVSPEQAADLAALQAQIDGAAPAAAPAEPQGPDFNTEATSLVDMVAAMICGYEPKCLPLWGDDRKQGIAAALVPVMEKYNFTLGNIPPEITLLIMVGPPLYQSSKIIAEGMNKPAEKVVNEAPPPAADPSKTATASPEMMALKL